MIERLQDLDSFGEGDIEGVTRTLSGELGISASRLIHPTRPRALRRWVWAGVV